MSNPRQEIVVETARITIPSEKNRDSIIDRCSTYGAVGWIIAEIAYELLLGPHIRLLRTVALGSGIGAVVGLLTSTLQWSVFRYYVKRAGWWIVATTAGYTLAGLLSSILLYVAIVQTDFFRSNLPLQGIAMCGIAGVVVGGMQWPVLKDWLGPGVRWNSWMLPVTLGSALATPLAWLAGAGALALLAWAIGESAWPVVITGSYVTAAIVGSTIYGRFLNMGFSYVLPQPSSRSSRATVHEELPTSETNKEAIISHENEPA